MLNEFYSMPLLLISIWGKFQLNGEQRKYQTRIEKSCRKKGKCVIEEQNVALQSIIVWLAAVGGKEYNFHNIHKSYWKYTFFSFHNKIDKTFALKKATSSQSAYPFLLLRFTIAKYILLQLSNNFSVSETFFFACFMRFLWNRA